MAELPQQQPGISPEQEIRELEQKLEAKKRALSLVGKDASQEKEVFREVLKEHIEAAKPLFSPPEPQVSFTPPPTAQTSGGTQAQQRSDQIAKEERETELRKLIEFALSRTIYDAVARAQKSTPYLLDELHDHLVDDYYDKLVALRKLKQL